MQTIIIIYLSSLARYICKISNIKNESLIIDFMKIVMCLITISNYLYYDYYLLPSIVNTAVNDCSSRSVGLRYFNFDTIWRLKRLLPMRNKNLFSPACDMS